MRKSSRNNELQRLKLTDGNLEQLAVSLRGLPGKDKELINRVSGIIARVEENGDEALANLTCEFDCPRFEPGMIKVPAVEIEAAGEGLPEPLAEALKLAAENIKLFHQHELRGGWTAPMRQSQMLGQKIIPVGRAGLYVPGGSATYASTVLMNAIPAQVAGVKEIFICTPPDNEGRLSQAVLGAAAMLGIEEIYRVGGAQAIAAMALGTETIKAADVICGPGNVYVTEAKRQVFGRVGIDSLAGPSEVLIIADKSAQPDLMAADLLAQVEHGSGAIAVLACWSEKTLDAVANEVAALCREMGIAEAMADQIALVYVESGEPLKLSVSFSNVFAPEHLQIHTEQPELVAHDITSAGAVFMGERTCTAYGDYIIGSNHVLPTAGTARFDSALSVDNFQKKVAVVSLIPETIDRLTPHLMEMAKAEGLVVHARAAELRMEKFGEQAEEEEK